MANKTKARRPSNALLNMMPKFARDGLSDLERERDDDDVTPEAWEAHAMELMQQVNVLPPVIRDAFGRAVQQLGALERREEQKAKAGSTPERRASRNWASGDPRKRALGDEAPAAEADGGAEPEPADEQH